LHIPDGFLDAKTWVTTAAVSAGALSYGVKKTREVLADRQVPLMGALSAFIFAAQMVNFPIIGGTSGHLIGATLAAVFFGPWVAMIMMATIVGLQCLVFLDGGLTVLGANILNIAIIAPFSGYFVYRGINRAFSGERAHSAAVFAASWVSVMLASAAAALELAISGTAPLLLVLTAMLGWHLLIGLGEGAITVVAVKYVSKVTTAEKFAAKTGGELS